MTWYEQKASNGGSRRIHLLVVVSLPPYFSMQDWLGVSMNWIFVRFSNSIKFDSHVETINDYNHLYHWFSVFMCYSFHIHIQLVSLTFFFLYILCILREFNSLYYSLATMLFEVCDIPIVHVSPSFIWFFLEFDYLSLSL